MSTEPQLWITPFLQLCYIHQFTCVSPPIYGSQRASILHLTVGVLQLRTHSSSSLGYKKAEPRYTTYSWQRHEESRRTIIPTLAGSKILHQVWALVTFSQLSGWWQESLEKWSVKCQPECALFSPRNHIQRGGANIHASCKCIYLLTQLSYF